MTQEDKELLLKDLCSRLPYGVKGQAKGMIKFFADEEVSEEPWTLTSINVQLNTFGADTQTGIPLFNRRTGICNFKPYLFPLSSMTEEERITIGNEFAYGQPYKAMDILHQRHIDYRGLISMGLAVDATGLNIY